MATIDDYCCPRCGYTTHHRSSMRNHLFRKNKPCAAKVELVELTTEVKEYILDNKIYRPLAQQHAILHSHVRKNKKQTITHSLRVACWNKYIGEEVGRTTCLCCKSTFITQLNFHCGHVIAEAVGGTINIDNLRPICSSCNSSMGTTNMHEFALKNFNNEM